MDKELVREAKGEVGLVCPTKSLVKSESRKYYNMLEHLNISDYNDKYNCFLFQPVLCSLLSDGRHGSGEESEIVSLARAQRLPCIGQQSILPLILILLTFEKKYKQIAGAHWSPGRSTFSQIDHFFCFFKGQHESC